MQAGGFTGTTDAILRQFGKRRTMKATTSHFSAVPYLLAGTDLIANVPVHAARAMCRADLDLVWFPQPLPVNAVSLQVGWKTSSAADPLFARTKDLLIEILEGLSWRI